MTGRQVSRHTSQFRVLLGFLALSLIISGLGGLLTASSIRDWYPGLVKPGFNPPNWIFGPVWSLLYLMMAVAAWRVWRAAGWRDARTALTLYFIQLGLNLAWSALFFILRQPAWALADCLLLLFCIIATGLLFRRHDRIAGLLFVPYAAWVAFAALLNGAIVALN